MTGSVRCSLSQSSPPVADLGPLFAPCRPTNLHVSPTQDWMQTMPQNTGFYSGSSFKKRVFRDFHRFVSSLQRESIASPPPSTLALWLSDSARDGKMVWVWSAAAMVRPRYTYKALLREGRFEISIPLTTTTNSPNLFPFLQSRANAPFERGALCPAGQFILK